MEFVVLKNQKKKAKDMDAVCSYCQRMIKNGLPSYTKDGVTYTRSDLVPHPAVGVFIDVGKDGWEKEFKDFHNRCRGSLMLPEAISKPKGIDLLWDQKI